MRNMRVAAAIALCSVASGLSTSADTKPQEYTAIPKVTCQADRVEKPANDASSAFLIGHAQVTFPGFRLRADKIELSYHPTAPYSTKGILVMAEGHVILEQGKQETLLRNLTFEIDAPR